MASTPFVDLLTAASTDARLLDALRRGEARELSALGDGERDAIASADSTRIHLALTRQPVRSIDPGVNTSGMRSIEPGRAARPIEPGRASRPIEPGRPAR